MPSSPRLVACGPVIVAAVALALTVGVSVHAQQDQPKAVGGTNVNMVSGTSFPDGDPYLQRQNEPSGGSSTRNPLHMLVGANDYRTVDLPGPFDPLRGFKMNADAWVGLFKSIDGGQNWVSTLVPGFPQDISAEGLASPIKGREASTDPVMRPGTNGMFYYAGVAFDRGVNKPSAIFMARYMDLNNLEAGDPFGYVDTRLVDSDGGARFLDKVAVATDIPRTTATCTITSRQNNGTTHVQTIPAGPVYVAYAAFTGSGDNEQSVIMFSRSSNCGATWSAPIALSTGSRLVQNPQIAVSPTDGAVYVSWRRFRYTSQDDAVMIVKSVNGGVSFGKAVRVSGVRPFDQGTTPTSFRSNGFQTMAIDGTGRVYLAWPDRGYAAVRSDPLTGDSRIVMSTSTTGATWTVPRAIQAGGIGHQLMPAMTFHGGKLRLLYYDLREDVSQLFGQYIDELPILTGAPPRIRHTMDVFVAQALPGASPTFTTARVSDYASGFLPGSNVEQRLQFNPPNLPLFRQGAVPFMGDYIDLAPAPPFVLTENGTWAYNINPNGSVVSHAFWTDNRDVRPPADGNWANYTPVTSPAVGAQSRFDPTKQVPGCVPGQVGMRNQNIYTARVTDGLFVSAPGNNKSFNGFQRAFVVVAENATSSVRTYRLRIENQPPSGQASFLQFGLLTTLDVTTPVLSSVARTVFVTAQDENARIQVSVTEVTAPGGAVVPNGLTGTVVLNPDPRNPVLQNPVLQNPVLQNIAQGESYNPGITTALVGVPSLQNPVLQNPVLQNPHLQNPSIQNPHLQNPVLQNPVLQNPVLQNPVLQNPVLQNDAISNPSIVNADLQNPVLQNPVLQNPVLQNPVLQNPVLQNPVLQNADLTNAGVSDTNWLITNEGNTTASYTVNLVLNTPPPAGFATQLLLHKTSFTPAADGCELAQQAHTILLANIPNPQFVALANAANPSLQNPVLQNPTLALAPGESATITFRVVDPNIFDGVTYDASGAVTPAAVAQSVNSEDVAAGRTTPQVAMPLTITTTEIPPTTPGAPINRTLQSVASTGALRCSVVSGQLPPGVTLSPTGTLSGTATEPGNYVFTVRCTDAANHVDEQTLSIQVNPASPVGFDAMWNGSDANWYNPVNWSPHGVPTAASRVYLSAATSVTPRLTADVTIRDLFLEPGATLDTNGFTLTVTNNADAGHTIVGDGRTVLTGSTGTASGVFADLEIQGRVSLTAPLTTTGTLTLTAGARLELNGQPLIVGGQLITNVTEGALPVIIGAENNVFLATGVDVNGLVLIGAPLTINAGALTRFDNVAFSGFAPEAVQLTVNNPGLVTHFPMNGLSFSSQPSSGQYVQANDTLLDGPPLILDVMGAVPADGTPFTLTGGGALVNWLGNPGEANLAVTQTVTPVPAAAGTRLTYTITVTNGGPVAAQSVVLNPGVPFGASSVTATASAGSCIRADSGGFSCTLGSLAPGASAQATVSFLTAVAGTLYTTASVTSSTPDSVIANNFHTIGAVVVPAGGGVNLRLTKSDSADPVAVNTPFTYTLAATNMGSTVATNVVVTDNIPAGLTISTYPQSASGMCSASQTQVICSVASLSPGETVTITFNAVSTAVGTYTNQASVTAAQIELTPGDNVATQTTTVAAAAPAGADLSLAMSESADPVTLGSPFSYTLVAHNGGPGTATGVVVTDTLPAGLAVSSALTTQGSCTVAAQTVTCALGVLGNNASATITLNVTASAAGIVHNSANLIATQADPVSENNTADAETTVALASCATPGYSSPVRVTVPTFDGLFVEQADLNADGAKDLVVSMLLGGLAVRLNDGHGNFGPAMAAPALSNWPRGLAVADLNRDGKLDIAAVTGTSLEILIGAGDGTFAAPVAYTAGANDPINVAAADLDNDGDIDLVIDSDGSPSLSVYKNNGSGALAAPLTVAVGPSEAAFPVVANLNADGIPDIVVGTESGFAVILADGAGGYLPATVIGTGDFYVIRGAADLTGDGKVDLIAQTADASGLKVMLFRGDGAGGFDAGTVVSNDSTVRSLRLADVNRDGRLDIVAHHPTQATVSVQLGQAGGAFAAAVHYPAPYALNPGTMLQAGGADEDFYTVPSAGDLNGDGQIDIAVPDPSGAIQVLFSTCGQPAGDLSVTAHDSADPVPEGGSLSYAVAVTNNGATSAAATLNLSLAVGSQGIPLARFTGASPGGACSVADQQIACSLPALASGQTFNLQVDVTTLAGGTVTLMAAATSNNADSTPANNTAFETTTVTASGRTLVVSNTNDSGPGSLRQAIRESNVDSGDRDTIVFNIPGAGVPTITLQTQLGLIDQPVVIDGTTQPGSGRVELNGNGLQGTGLVIGGGNSIVRGLVINRFGFDAISLEASGGNSVIEGNFIGTDSTGSLARPNLGGGIRVFSANNRIGGTTAAARNVISGNQGAGVVLQGSSAITNVVQGNYIGLGAGGLAALPNSFGGIRLNNGAAGNTIGGTVAGAGNVISGNTGPGIFLGGSNGTIIQGNLIGLDAGGTLDRGNTQDGISTSGVNGTIVGGTTPGARNVVSGNDNAGIRIAGGTGNTALGNYIGTNAQGGGAVPNNAGLVLQGSAIANVIGGAVAGAGNVISGNTTNGITLQTGANNNTIQGNLIGVDAAGTINLGNTGNGIHVNGVSGTTIGGTSAAARNIVSGNNGGGIRLSQAGASSTTVTGNYVGVNPAGGLAIANGGPGIVLETGAHDNTIGGLATGAGNLVSGNALSGITLMGATVKNNVIQGNRVGTDALVTTAIPNQSYGVNIADAANNLVGGSGVAARNIISGNRLSGVFIGGSGGTASGNNVLNNFIGTNGSGMSGIGNGEHGVLIQQGATGNAIGAAGAGNVISGNVQNGIAIVGATTTGNTVGGNRIGTNATGTQIVANSLDGVRIDSASNNTIGGAATGAGNTIAGNTQHGIGIYGGASGNQVKGNVVGMREPPNVLGNGLDGIQISSGSNNIIGGSASGEANTISWNGRAGVGVGAGTGNTVLSNSIFANTGRGIDLLNNGLTANDSGDGDTGPNNLQNFPVLTATTGGVQGTLNSSATSTFTIQFFGNAACDPTGHGEGESYLGQTQVTTDGNGNATLPLFEAAAGQIVTATATSAAGETSEFSACATILLSPATFTVTNTNDSGPGSLRQAMLDANDRAGTRDTIVFNIPGAGPHRIAPTTPLPIVIDPVIIDGTTEPDFAGTPVIELHGVNAGPTTNGLWLRAGSSVVRGLTINAFGTGGAPGSGGGAGIVLEMGGANLIEGNFIGTDVAGATARPNRMEGIWVDSGGNQIGGTTAAARNVISGNGRNGIQLSGANATNNVIRGNYIGTDRQGSVGLANASHGVLVMSASNTVGGNTTGAANVISSNGGSGVWLLGTSATNNVVTGNLIGTNSQGTSVLGNAVDGVTVGIGTNNVIGGTSAALRNVISGNSRIGVLIEGAGATANRVIGNYIGTDLTGAADLGNGFDGVFVSVSGNFVGGPTAAEGNVISGNGRAGVNLGGAGTVGSNVVQSNKIGVSAAGTGPLPNAYGVFVESDGNTIGGSAGNFIAHNSLAGIDVRGQQNRISSNRIASNGGLGIDLGGDGITANDSSDSDGGPNNRQNFPVLTAAAGGVQGTLNSSPNATFTIQFFGSIACDASGNGEGETFLGSRSVTTDVNGDATLPLFTVSPVQVVTATATSAGGDTSEFSTCVTSRPPNSRPVANAGPDQSSYVGRLVTLAGTGSDPDADNLTYAWSFTSRPTGSQAALTNATAPGATFTPDVAGTYTAQLVVNDGTDSSLPDSVSITVLSNQIALALVGAQVVGVTREAPVSVTLPFAAPSGGTTVTVTSANASILSVVAPGTTLIPAGQTVGQIMVKGEGSGTALLRANATGYGQGTLSVQVTQNLISTPGTLNVAFGGTTALPINIGPDPAPAGGLTLNVASSDADIEVVTAQVTVPAGALSVNATVRGARVGTANVTVSNGNYAPSTTVVTSRAELNVVQTSASFNQGLPAPTLTVRLESNGTQIAAQPALTVSLTSANTSCVTVPASVTIPAGLVSTSFSPAYGGTATLPCTTTVTASATDVTPDTVSITVNRPATIDAGSTLTVGAGLMENAYASLNASQHGGLDVTITAGTPAQPGPVRLSRSATEVGTQSITVHLDNGQTSISYYVHGLENTTGSSTITLAADGVTGDTFTVDVVQPVVEIQNLNPSMNTLSGPDPDVYVRVGITHPSYNNAQLWQVQNVRAGSPGLEVTLTNSNANVARLRSDEPAATGGQTGQAVKKTIAAGRYLTQSLTAGTNYGFAFEPLGTGTTTVTVTAPGAVTMTSTGVRQVQVTSPVINASNTVTVGAGLMESAYASLSASQHGGVDVTITAGTPAQGGPVRLSRSATEVGTQSITVHLDNGQTSISYYVHGLENTTGSSTITLTADRFTGATHTVDVVQPVVEIQNLNPSMNTLSGPDPDVYVRVGITHPSYNNAQLWQVQNVRAGSPGLEVTLTNSNVNVARLRSDEPAATGGQTGQVVKKTIAAGRYLTQSLTAGTTYGFAFEPLGTGTTTVTVTAPGAVTMTSTGVRQVQVTSPAINAGSTVTVGAGLMESAYSSLSASQHGGVDVTITAGTPAQAGPVRLSRSATEVGTQSITVHLDNGQTSISYYVHGLENTTGSSTITLTADRFTGGTHTVDVVQPVVEIQNLEGSYTNLSADDIDVYVRVGITHPSYNNAQLWRVQNVRAGSPGLEVTLTNSNVNVARLRSDEPAATGGQTGQVVKKTIAAGRYLTQSLTTGTNYGFAFEPLANGSTTVTVTAPGALTMTSTGVRPVTVTTPALYVSGTATIGAGLMDSVGATLGASEHGGVDVTITSSASSVLLVSPNTNTTGTASTVVHVDNGQTNVPFVIHGMENVNATAVITLSAPGFTSTTMSVTVTPSSVEIQNLSSSISATAPDDVDVYVRVGITHPSYNNSQLWRVQSVRAGSPGFVVTLSVDNAARAQLRSDEPVATGSSVTKPIKPGYYLTQRLIQSGTTYGLAFDPLTAGTVVVTVTGPPGTQPLDSSRRTVVINP